MHTIYLGMIFAYAGTALGYIPPILYFRTSLSPNISFMKISTKLMYICGSTVVGVLTGIRTFGNPQRLLMQNPELDDFAEEHLVLLPIV